MKLALPAVIIAAAVFGSNAQQINRRRVETVDLETAVEESPEAEGEIAAIEDPEGGGYYRQTAPCCSWDFATCGSYRGSFCNTGPHQCEAGCGGHWIQQEVKYNQCVPLWGTCYPDFGRPCMQGDKGCDPCPGSPHGCHSVGEAELAGLGGYGSPCVAGDSGCSPCPKGPHGCHPVPPPPRCCGPDPHYYKKPPPPCHDRSGSVCTAGAPDCKCDGIEPPSIEEASFEDPNHSGYSNGYKGGYWYGPQGYTACSVDRVGYSQCQYYPPRHYYGGSVAIEEEDADIVLAEFSMAAMEAEEPKSKSKAHKLRH